MTPEKTLIRDDTLAELRELIRHNDAFNIDLRNEIKKLQAENKKLRERTAFELDAFGGYLLGVKAPQSVMKEYLILRKALKELEGGE